jgi:peptide/nickel transport system substrate-binding protein
MSTFKELEKMLSTGRISRRGFLAGVSAIGLTAAVSPAFLPSTARAGTPRKGGMLRVGCTGGSTTDSLDPGLLTSNMNQFLNYEIHNSLVEIDHNLAFR